MKLINYIYFNIYNWYFEMKTDGRKVNPQSLTSMAFGLCVGGWVILFTVFYLQFITQKVLIPDLVKYIIGFVILISAGLINEFYSSGNRYQKIYKEYISGDIVKNKKKGVLLSFLFIFLPYFILVMFGIILVLV